MMKTIYTISFASYTNENYGALHLSEPTVFTSWKAACERYKKEKQYARQVAANEFDDLGNGQRYDVNETEDDSSFEVSRETDREEERYTAKVVMTTKTILL